MKKVEVYKIKMGINYTETFQFELECFWRFLKLKNKKTPHKKCKCGCTEFRS